MPSIKIEQTEKYLEAIGALASRGYGFETRDPDILIVGNREIEVLVDEGIIPRPAWKKEPSCTTDAKSK